MRVTMSDESRTGGLSPRAPAGIILQKQEKYIRKVRIQNGARDILTAIMNKALLRILLPVLVLATFLAFAFALSQSTTGSAQGPLHVPAGGHAPTPTPTPEDRSQPGSTEGLVILSLAIIAIIMLPILLQRSLWSH